jgi:hypothetical protein
MDHLKSMKFNNSVVDDELMLSMEARNADRSKVRISARSGTDDRAGDLPEARRNGSDSATGHDQIEQ